MKIKVTINDIPREYYTDPNEKVRDLLRREAITRVRDGCDSQGSCGACSIILNGKLVNSCLLLSPQIDGKEIYTVEHLSKNRELSAIQTAFLDAGVVQC
ncbi:2Fe-2S iron-sulfur cluster binding domain-containing protein, partial [bacterium]|nr:2Fe-2S iron-sulfur cluster binding domain-containing protein [bacterium]